DALAKFLLWEYVPGEASLLRSVRKLKPGHLVEVDLDQPSFRPIAYWDVPHTAEAEGLNAKVQVEVEILPAAHVFEDLLEPEAHECARGIVMALSDEQERTRGINTVKALYEQKYSRAIYEKKMRQVLKLVD
ncbi:MAG: hypothetical protein O7G83_16150, partial [Proteobacteria bacterium]|nr:hypothetical protein [Pseudomonadota bacterium]